jgi:hypothetical protein
MGVKMIEIGGRRKYVVKQMHSDAHVHEVPQKVKDVHWVEKVQVSVSFPPTACCDSSVVRLRLVSELKVRGFFGFMGCLAGGWREPRGRAAVRMSAIGDGCHLAVMAPGA